jgi:ketosteroid isomerase-like protein
MHCNEYTLLNYQCDVSCIMSKKVKVIDSKGMIIILSNEQMVNRYFQLIGKRDVHGLLDLFADDATVYEPFSNMQNGLQGKSAIENFLKVAIMANTGMSRTITFLDEEKNKDLGEGEGSIAALVSFERGDNVTAKFTFHFIMTSAGRKIKTLKIQFAGF